MTAYKCLLYEVKDAIATLTLNRPDRLNALGDTLRDDLPRRGAACQRRRGGPRDGDHRRGQGLLLRRRRQGDERGQGVRRRASDGEKVAPLRDRVLLAMRDAPQPIIAAVNGAAAGAGMNLALGCDIRLASTAARFGETFARRGLHPDWGGTYFLPRLVGMAKAAELIFTGDMIDAAEALRLGIVSALHSPEELMPATYDLARRDRRGAAGGHPPRQAGALPQPETDLRGGLEFETFAQNICFETEDAREGIRAFVEKRPPQFKGR